MTTDNPTPATAGSEQPLSAGEVAALEAVAENGYVWSSDTPDYKNPGKRPTFSRDLLDGLFYKGLLTIEVALSNGCRYALAASQQAAGRPETVTAKDYHFSVGQVVRYVGSNHEEIPYHIRGTIESLDKNVSDWYQVTFENLEGIRSVSGWALIPATEQPAQPPIVRVELIDQQPYWAFKIFVDDKPVDYSDGYHTKRLAQTAANDAVKEYQKATVQPAPEDFDYAGDRRLGEEYDESVRMEIASAEMCQISEQLNPILDTRPSTPESGKRNQLRPKDIDALWKFYRAVEDVMDNNAAGTRFIAIDKALDVVRTELES